MLSTELSIQCPWYIIIAVDTDVIRLKPVSYTHLIIVSPPDHTGIIRRISCKPRISGSLRCSCGSGLSCNWHCTEICQFTGSVKHLSLIHISVFDCAYHAGHRCSDRAGGIITVWIEERTLCDHSHRDYDKSVGSNSRRIQNVQSSVYFARQSLFLIPHTGAYIFPAGYTCLLHADRSYHCLLYTSRCV